MEQLPQNFFRSTHRDAGSNGMAFLNYPAPETPPAGDDIRAGSHKGTISFQQFFKLSTTNYFNVIDVSFANL
jgi:hypothetical protein